MWAAVRLILIYLLMQVLAALTAGPVTVLYVYLVHGVINVQLSQQLAMAPTMLIGFIYMAWYLGKKGYLKDNGQRYSTLTPATLLWSLLAGVGAIVLLSGLSILIPLPDLLEQTFDTLQSGWLGILCVALLGPVLEELLFRGAVTDELLRKYSPVGAIVISDLLFGLFHINPPQVLSGCFIGFLLAWLYWKTRSLVPGILVHVLNNSLSVFLSLRYPEIKELNDLPGMQGAMLAVCLVAAAVLLAFSVWKIQKTK